MSKMLITHWIRRIPLTQIETQSQRLTIIAAACPMKLYRVMELRQVTRRSRKLLVFRTIERTRRTPETRALTAHPPLKELSELVGKHQASHEILHIGLTESGS